MKATELMIGDWVMFDNELLQVSEILKDGICANNDTAFGCYPFENLEPVLLTEDILQKNGFKHLDISSPRDTINRWRYSTDSQDINLSYWQCAKGYLLELFSIHIYPIIYVHELQNSLRIGGVKKKIEL